MAETKKKKNRHIGYFIFLAIITSFLIFLIYKKVTLPEEKPMKSLPEERPVKKTEYVLLDSSARGDTIYEEEISLLSPELPKVRVHDPVAATAAGDLMADDGDIDEPAATETQVHKPTPQPSVTLKTEQSVRNMLLSNRFVDRTSGEVITFTNNGNVLVKNGQAQTSEMEMQNLSGNKAVMYFYDDRNNSWDVTLDVSGQYKRLEYMNNMYTAE